MLNKLVAIFLSKEKQQRAKLIKLYQDEVDRCNRIADTLEQALVKGTYFEPGYSKYMCVAVEHQMGLPHKLAQEIKEYILSKLNNRSALISYLISEDYAALKWDSFERRIRCSVWYWERIRELRQQAKDIRHWQTLV